MTLGNALRRVLLSSLEGAAVTSIQVRDVYHEFASIPGVKEDVTQIVLNVKKLRLKCYAPHPVQLQAGQGRRRRRHRRRHRENADVEIVNPEQQLLTLDSDDVTLEMDLTVERGVGYLAAERTEQLPIGVIPVDAIFTPVRKVNYTVENTRVGQMTNFDKPDHRGRDGRHDLARGGPLPGGRAAGRPVQPLHPRRQGPAGAASTPAPAARSCSQNMLDMPIEDLDLPMRAYNSLKRNNIVKVGQLLQLSDDDLLRMRNFGRSRSTR